MITWYADANADQRGVELLPWIDRVCDWLTEHGVNPDRCRRAEVEVIDAPVLRAFVYDLNDEGRLTLDPATGHAREHVVELLARSQPPERPPSS